MSYGLVARPARAPLVPERTDFLEEDAPAAATVEAFLTRALEATDSVEHRHGQNRQLRALAAHGFGASSAHP